jgi:hypothetical protein
MEELGISFYIDIAVYFGVDIKSKQTCMRFDKPAFAGSQARLSADKLNVTGLFARSLNKRKT